METLRKTINNPKFLKLQEAILDATTIEDLMLICKGLWASDEYIEQWKKELEQKKESWE